MTGRKGRIPALVFVGIALVLWPGSPLAAQEEDLAASQRQIEDRTVVLQTVRELLDALGSGNLVRLEALHLPQAITISIGSGGEAAYPSIRTLSEVIESIGSVTVPMLERIWDPEVRVEGDIAMVWSPYDFYIDGSFSHCGHDTFQLVRVQESWRIAALAYTISQPPDCALHPDGPPAVIAGSR